MKVIYIAEPILSIKADKLIAVEVLVGFILKQVCLSLRRWC